MMVLPAEVPSRLQLLPLMELPPPREPLKPLPRSACRPSCWTRPPLLSLHQEQHTQPRNAYQALAQLPPAGCEVAASVHCRPGHLQATSTAGMPLQCRRCWRQQLAAGMLRDYPKAQHHQLL